MSLMGLGVVTMGGEVRDVGCVCVCVCVRVCVLCVCEGQHVKF